MVYLSRTFGPSLTRAAQNGYRVVRRMVFLEEISERPVSSKELYLARD
jgi:hypothetical protein